MRFGQLAFAFGMIASGALNFANKGFYSPWDPIPTWVPAHVWLGYAYGAILVLGGLGLVLEPVATVSARALFACLAIFLVLLKTPVLLSDPTTEVHWLDYGQIATLVAGAWTLSTTNETQLRAARYLLGAALLPIGVSHFVYLKVALPMVPAMLPFHPAWVIFTGAAHIAAGVAILVGVLARLAAVLEASMVTAFGLFVWLLPLIAKPTDVNIWVEEIVTLAVASGVWAVASKMPAHSRAQPNVNA